MPPTILVSLLANLSLANAPTPSANLADLNIADYFRDYRACLVLHDMDRDWTLRYGGDRGAERMTPCSTFKIFNALVGLDCGVLTGPDHKFKYDGSPQPIKSWQRDHTLATAIQNSVVWVFKEIARKIGEPRMKKAITAAHYGNEDISGGIDQFWLHSTLKISADEQVALLTKLYRDELPFKKTAQSQVRDMLVLERGDNWTFSGKTGSHYEDGHYVLGWFVGCAERDGRRWVFAMNIDRGEEPSGMKAKAIARTMLTELGILPADGDQPMRETQIKANDSD